MLKKYGFKPNMGVFDRMLRLCAGICLLVLGSLVMEGTFATVLLVLGGLAVITSIIGFCPGYVPFGISTVGFAGARPELMSKMMARCCQGSAELPGCCNMMGGTRESANKAGTDSAQTQ